MEQNPSAFLFKFLHLVRLRTTFPIFSFLPTNANIVFFSFPVPMFFVFFLSMQLPLFLFLELINSSNSICSECFFLFISFYTLLLFSFNFILILASSLISLSFFSPYLVFLVFLFFLLFAFVQVSSENFQLI